MRIALLGPVRVRSGDAEVSAGSPLRCAVLTVLALRAGHAVTLEELVDAIWGDEPPSSAESSIYTYISGLRSLLEPGRRGRDRARVLTGDRAGYTLRLSAEEVDALLAERRRTEASRLRAVGDEQGALAALDGAVSLWRDEALAGVPGPFAKVERLRLTELRWSLREERAELLIASGRHYEVADELAALSDEYPQRERTAALVMLALHRSGRQSEAMAIYRRVERLLGAELGVAPGEELRHVHDAITAGSATEPGSIRIVPAQLPHDVAGFTGRGAELDALVTPLLRDGTPVPLVITAIDGAGGIGKTALAVHAAHRMRERYPDGQLYLDMRGFDPRQPPLHPSEALTRVLPALGVDIAEVPADVDEQAALYRSRLAGMNVLVLLDNAASTDQVRDLLPGTPGCVVIVTSRNRLAGLVAQHGAVRITLGTLPAADAAELLRFVIGAERAETEPGALTSLAQLCGFFPLALRIAGERVAARPDHTLADLVEELESTQDRIEVLSEGDDDTSTIRAVFSWSYLALKPDEARLFRFLSLYPGVGISGHAAVAVSGETAPSTRKRLRALARSHLLEEIGRDRYRYHDLLRVYAAERCAEEDTAEARDGAMHRLLQWYLHTGNNAAEILRPADQRLPVGQPPDGVQPLTFHDHAEASSWTAAEAATLAELTRQAARGRDHAVALRLAVNLNSVWKGFVALETWTDILQAGLASARESDGVGVQAFLRLDLGFVNAQAARFEEAMTNLELAHQLFEQAGDDRGRARALGNMGVNLEHMGRQEQAIARLAEAKELFAKCGDPVGQARSAFNIGQVLDRLGRYAEVGARLAEARKLFMEVGDRIAACRTHAKIGHNLYRLGEFDRAVQEISVAVETARTLGDPYTLASNQDYQAQVLAGCGKHDQALTALDEAVELYRQLGAVELGTALHDRSKIHKVLGNLAEQERDLLEALPFSERFALGSDEEIRTELERLHRA